jgi:hypothetical protein
VRPESFRALSFLAVVAALTLVGAVFVPRWFKLADSPETELLVSLKRLEQDGVRAPIAGSPAPLASDTFGLDRLTVELLPDGMHARAVFTLDFNGTLGTTKVSALGLERLTLNRTAEGWRPDEGVWTPTLATAVEALLRRTQALERQDAASLSQLLAPGGEREPQSEALTRVFAMTEIHYAALAWYLRADRGQVLVTEEYRLTGALPDRPVDDKGQRRLTLVPVGKELRFLDSLM